MRKIPTIFERDWNGDKSRVLDKPVAECQWVFDGEGIATRKFDGTAVLIENGRLFCRFDAKHGKPVPKDFRPVQSEADEQTGHWPGWVPAELPQHKWQLKAFAELEERAKQGYRGDALLLDHVPDNPMAWFDGTWEACGPHFQGNPEDFAVDVLVRHGQHKIPNAPRTFTELAQWFKTSEIEGIVWHHPDGRMAKIKKRDFGMKR